MTNTSSIRIMIIGPPAYFLATQLVAGLSRLLEPNGQLNSGKLHITKDYTFETDNLRVVALQFESKAVLIDTAPFSEFIAAHRSVTFLVRYWSPSVGVRGAVSFKKGEVYESVRRRLNRTDDSTSYPLPDLFTEHLPAGITF